MGTLVIEAKKAIGENSSKDYQIDLTKIPNVLKDNASVLSSYLENSKFTEIAKRYKEQDTTALKIQKDFKKYAHRTTVAICFSAVSGSLIACIAATEWTGIFRDGLIIILGSLSLIFGGYATYALHHIRTQKLLERWMTSRAEAETHRLGYFAAIAKNIVKDKSEQNDRLGLLLFICMFKRYQIDVQYTYYTERSTEHRDSLKITSLVGAIAALWLACISGISGISGILLSPEILPFAALGTIGAAISTAASRREELNQDEKNAERYERTAMIISKLAEMHDDVLNAVENNKSPLVITKYVAAINDQLSLEHRQWTSNKEEMTAALSDLELAIQEGSD